MNISRRDLARLALPLLACGCAAGLGGMLLAWSGSRLDSAERQRDATRSSRNALEHRLGQVRGEARDRAARAEIFARLQAAGIVGDDQRLAWAAKLRATQRDLQLPGLHYEFAAQAPLDASDHSQPAFFSTPLRLQLQLRHEAELLDFLARLEQDAGALVLVDGCHVARRSEGDRVTGLNADCRLQWLTIHRAATQP
ncbi:MAG: hypothetical protein ACM3X0_05345 [Bacteroidota bacterium]